MLFQSKNRSETDRQRIRHSNASLQELAKRRLMNSHLSHGWGSAIVHEMFLNDVPALVCFNKSHNVQTYGTSVSFSTNGLSSMNETRCTGVRIHRQLQRNHDATRLFHVPIPVSCQEFRLFTNGRLSVTIILKKRWPSGQERKRNI